MFSQEALSVPGGVSNGAAMSFATVIMVDGWDSGWFGTVIAVDGLVIGWLGSGLLDVEARVSVNQCDSSLGLFTSRRRFGL